MRKYARILGVRAYTQDSEMPKRRKRRKGLSYLSADAQRIKAARSAPDNPTVVQVSL